MEEKKPKKLLYLKAFIIAVVIIVIIIYLIATSPLSAHAADWLNLPDAENFGDVPELEGETGVEKAQNLIGRLMAPFRIIIGAVGVALIVLSGFTLAINSRNEETVSKQKKGLIWGIIGLAVISISGSIAEIFNFQEGSFLGDEETIAERAGLFDSRATVVITFLKYILGSIAVFTMVRSAMVLITSGGSAETVTREKKNLLAGFVAIIFVIISDYFVRKVLFDVQMSEGDNMAVVSINPEAGVSEIMAITNFVVMFIGPIMILGIVAGGLMYALAGGDEERASKARKILINSVIGAVVVYGAFAIVSTIISGVM